MGRPSQIDVSTKQQRIAGIARQAPEMALTSLSHHIDLNWLYEAYRRTRKDGAPGVDGQTAKEYEETFSRLLKRYPLPAPIAVHSIYRNVVNP